MDVIAIHVTVAAAEWCFRGGWQKAIIRMAADATVGAFMAAIRTKLPELRPEDAMFAFWGGAELAAMHTPLSHLVKKHRSRGGGLPVTIRAESAFGSA